MIAAGIFTRTYPAFGVELCRPQDGMPSLSVLDYKGRPRKSYEFILRNPSPNADASPEETTINRSWIDLKLATKWKDTCIDRHGSKCHKLDKAALIAPDWLIDTKEDCIVRGETSMEFVALSYRWGTSVGSGVGRDKLDELRKPGGLSSSFIVELPIIRDAIHVVRSINERYLWADTMCIMHDDKDHLAHQLQHMGAIYASAKLAIIATDGDGMAGIPGLQGCSAPRNLNNSFPWTDNREVFVRDLPSLSYIHASEYYKRGWTFQENILSQRRLIIGKQQIHWTCGCGTWHEDLPHERAQIDESNDSVLQSLKSLRRRPDFNGLGSLLRAYNCLEMTYPEDALPGIAGLLGLINSSFDGGFLFGLPIMCFEASLLWGSNFWYNIINTGHKGIERRICSSRTHSLLPDAELPSWSWVGWKSDYLSLLKDEEDYQVVTYPNQARDSFTRSEKWITIPTTQWFCLDTPESTTKRRIYSSWFAPYEEAPDLQNLPAGWVREKYPGTKGLDITNMRSLPFGITGDYVYHHPELPNRLYWRPFPVASAGEIAKSSQTKQAKFLSCKTKRGWFRYSRKTGYTMEAGSMDYHLRLLDKHDRTCGWVQLPHEDATLPSHSREASAVIPNGVVDDTQALSDTSSSLSDSSSEIHNLVEVVVICERLSSRSVNEKCNGWLDKRDYRHFYGILCIEWDNGIAYRKGCGYIKTEVWDQHDVEDVDLVLG
ncbi:heterokaryon incompatibility domain-containing protein [Trichoderma barbatum]